MKRQEQIAILQSIAAGKISIQKAVAAINIKEHAIFFPLIGMDLAEYQDGNILQDIILIDGIPGRMKINNNLPDEEIYI